MSLTTSELKGRDFEGAIARLIADPRLRADQRKVLQDFIDELRDGELSPGAQRTYALILRDLAVNLAKPFKEATRNDIRDFINVLEKRVGEISLRTYKSCVKRFYTWLYNAEEPPEVVSWIKTWGKPRKGIQELTIKDYIVTPEEYSKLINSTTRTRDQALIAILWDTGARPIEVLVMNIEDLDLNSDTPNCIVGRKRRLPLIESLPYIVPWMNLHPSRKSGKGPLWPSRLGERLTYVGLAEVFKDACKRAGLRNITPKMFRHTRATIYARRSLSPYVMNLAMGWRPDSKMWTVYHHLNGEDVIKGIREVYGLDAKEKAPEAPALKECMRCGHKVPVDSKFCLICGMNQDPEEALKHVRDEESLAQEIADLRAQMEEVLAKVKGK